ncbi:MAG: efflux RND transporter periplasmic adaptor subunit [Planctomycetota bacterium]
MTSKRTSTSASTSTVRLIRGGAVALGFAAVVVVLLLWLAGAFHQKVNAAGSSGPQGAAAGSSRPRGAAAAGRQLVAVRAIDVPTVEAAVGTVRAVQQTTISAEVMAKVIEVNVRAGQAVRKGDVLVRLDPEELQARLQQAEAAVVTARAARDQAYTEYGRVKGLYDQNNAALIELQRTETALKAAEADLEQAQQVRQAAAKNLSFTTIVSPFDGTVIDKQVEVGDTASPQKALLTLYDPTRMQLVASVRESLIDRVRTAQTVPVYIDALRRECQGTVTEIVPESDAASRSFLVKVSGPCPPDIHSGMFGRLLIPLDSERWLVIPRSAVRRIGQLEAVDVPDAAGEVLQRRVVRTGRTRGGEVEILSGLREGEQVALPAGAADAAGGAAP